MRHAVPCRRMAIALMASACLAHDSLAAPETHGTNTHWALQPVVRRSPPAVHNARWPRNAIDLFILARLEKGGLEPSAEADRRTWFRRVSFDLLGLPPSPEALDAFVTDPSPEAHERVVDRLLASPDYGARWGRHWLDVARYADNKGYVFFEEKTHPWAWTYRDYVVRAFNEDKPFDRFILEQLAADQLQPGPDHRALTAMGFLTVGDHFSNNTHDIIDDRIDVISRGLLGLTVGCARCHDHKFDAISMADYYGLYGVLRSSTEPMVPPLFDEPPASEPYEGFEVELIHRRKALRDFVESRHHEIVEGARTRIAEYLLAAHAQRDQPIQDNFMFIADKGDLNPSVVHRWRLYLERAGARSGIWAAWHAFAAIKAESFPAEAAEAHRRLLRPDSGIEWNRLVREAISKAPPSSMAELAGIYAGLLRQADAAWQEARRVNPSASRLADPDWEALRRVLYGADAPPDVPAQMDWGFLSLLPDRASQAEFQKLLTALEQWLMKGPDAPPRAMVLEDLPVAYEPRVFQRGNPGRPGARVDRRFLAALDPGQRPFQTGSGRLDLARAIASPANPLTARVMVNRIWLHHFGEGLVSTPGDFGSRGDPPAHPELLDWLADEFVRSDWSVKHMHRLIFGSATYRQASTSSADALAAASLRDPDNRLLSRMNRRRLDFESMRDAVLAASGQLEARAGGPPSDLASSRRTIDTFVNRMDIPPVLTTFDVPSPSTSCAQRRETTVPPQALYLMNNPFMVEAARRLARRPDVAACHAMQDKIAVLYPLVFGRPPSPGDLRQAGEFLGTQPGEREWSRYIQALLMANEFLFID